MAYVCFVTVTHRADLSAMSPHVKHVAGFDADGAELPCFTPCCDTCLCSGFRYSQNIFQSVQVQIQCQID